MSALPLNTFSLAHGRASGPGLGGASFTPTEIFGWGTPVSGNCPVHCVRLLGLFYQYLDLGNLFERFLVAYYGQGWSEGKFYLVIHPNRDARLGDPRGRAIASIGEARHEWS
jgi:hypothetical protein